MLTVKTLKYAGVIPQFKALTDEQQSLVDSYFDAIDLTEVASGGLEEAMAALNRMIAILADFPPVDQQIIQDVYDGVSDALHEIGQWANEDIGAGREEIADYWQVTGDLANWEELHNALTAKTVKLIGAKAVEYSRSDSEEILDLLEECLEEAERLLDLETWSEAWQVAGDVGKGGVVELLDHIMVTLGKSKSKLADYGLSNQVAKAKTSLKNVYMIAIEYAVLGWDDKRAKKYKYPRDLDKRYIEPAIEIIEKAIESQEAFIEAIPE